jgi:pimeloyl-ACP methyl ester carboxylesterase
VATTGPVTREDRVADIILIPGLWLDASAWNGVLPALEDLGHRPVPLTLPGQGDGATAATYDDQVAAVVAAVDDAGPGTVVVGHSAACTLAWAAADARPDDVARVVLIGGHPQADGGAYADFFEPSDGTVPFPGWEPFEGADAADLDDDARARFEDAAHPVPATVTTGVVHLQDEHRFDVPVVLVCPEFSAAQAQEWLDAGEMPELDRVARLEMVEIDSGHWPMLTRPGELAELLASVASQDD